MTTQKVKSGRRSSKNKPGTSIFWKTTPNGPRYLVYNSLYDLKKLTCPSVICGEWWPITIITYLQHVVCHIMDGGTFHRPDMINTIDKVLILRFLVVLKLKLILIRRFWKYWYWYWYWQGDFKNIDIDIDIDKVAHILALSSFVECRLSDLSCSCSNYKSMAQIICVTSPLLFLSS